MFLFSAEFSQGTVKLPAAVDSEDFWNIEPSCGSGARPGCVHIHRDKCEDKRIVLSELLLSYLLPYFLLVCNVALRYGNMALGVVMLTMTTVNSHQS